MPPWPSERQRTLALYRSFLREAGKLPHAYLTSFFRIWGQDYIRKNRNEQGLLTKKLRRLQQERNRLESANQGNRKSFNRVLEIAYGQRGKLRHELLETILQTPGVALPPRIIPAVEKSRPPVYSAALSALLTSPLSRHPRPLKSAALDTPPTLPARADRASEEARLLGPLSLRREVNIRWRFFTDQKTRVNVPISPPLEPPSKPKLELKPKSRLEPKSKPKPKAISLPHLRSMLNEESVHPDPRLLRALLSAKSKVPAEPEPEPEPKLGAASQSEKNSGDSIIPEHLRSYGIAEGNIIAQLEALTGSADARPPIPRRERASHSLPPSSDPNPLTAPMPTRWLRRRYRELLGRIPILTAKPKSSKSTEPTQYTVSLSHRAITSDNKGSKDRIPRASAVDIEWVRKAEGSREKKS
ncbi:hypothetical protein SISSUDRAFT_1132833 [Sistotremastrum suecicum HHB10207 ss-3]|uniref:LYR motif-containing protein Cup1-like N-terminal domain-containing protein n=1 Tax=Sistotremastrum suecicum HHB10207 ss-3 TaxID=1314776 RepID=A0A165Y7H6_9AGAM|nr:hypothetical protein SISSUDRAFT_1132833 [Sistotremastrum suecicum HHB10207 ss-3]